MGFAGESERNPKPGKTAPSAGFLGLRAVVQVVEHRSPKPAVAGSSPARPVSVRKVQCPKRGLNLTAIPLEDAALDAATLYSN